MEGSHSGPADASRPRVVLYLYVHSSEERFDYPSARVRAGADNLAARYLECVLVQVASLRLLSADCDIALVTNVVDRTALGERGGQLMMQIEDFGVELLHADYTHRPRALTDHFAAACYVFDAIEAAAAGQPDERPLWLVDVDCVWLDPERAFASLSATPEIACVHIGYPDDWDVFGYTPRFFGELVHQMGASTSRVDWVGGELLAGAARDLRALVPVCLALDEELAERGVPVRTEEQLLTIASALGRLSLRGTDLAGRVWTGPRHGAVPHPDPLSLALWHLPSEKGLALRRAARQIQRGRTRRLSRDLQAPRRAAQRFNVIGTGLGRRLRDDGWLALQRLQGNLRESPSN